MRKAYIGLVTRYPWLALLLVMAPAVLLGLELRHFGLDASARALLLEGDPDQLYYWNTRQVFGSDEYMILAYEDENLLTPAGARELESLIDDLRGIDVKSDDAGGGVIDSVFSLLDIPILSEESAEHETYEQRKDWTRFWLVPVDRCNVNGAGDPHLDAIGGKRRAGQPRDLDLVPLEQARQQRDYARIDCRVGESRACLGAEHEP